MFDDGQIEDGTTFFFGDVEFWGIESIRLMADMMRIGVTLTGFLHAASYTIGDAFEIAAPYQQFTEVGWIAALDKVFVGSHYHKQAVIERRLKLTHNRLEELADKIMVSGNPLFADAYPQFPNVAKKRQIVLTNRFDNEKEVGETLTFFHAMKVEDPSVNLVITTGRKTLRSNAPTLELRARQMAADGILEIREGLTKEEYHRTLAESLVMVSHSREENFGYCIVEAAHYNCQPLLRDNASHPELVGYLDRYVFNTPIQADTVKKALFLLDNPSPTAYMAQPFFHKPFQVILDHL